MSHSDEIKRMDPILNEPVLDHEYDGIEELDNPLPGWWLATFYLTIVFAAGYFTWHNIVGGAQLHERSYRAHRASLEAQALAREQAQAANIDTVALTRELQDVQLASAGSAVYTERCAACHGGKGEGLIGPNLTDANWKNGDGTPVAIWKIVDKGVMEKGMPAWGPVLSKDAVKQVSAFVISLKGSQPANAKAPEGEARP
ncbi:MAG: cbb3-type cytochrome c oxidase N-terminal domain-containing protein [Candidatus Sericytochromatia bacterium]